jgi:hypothetical protein
MMALPGYFHSILHGFARRKLPVLFIVGLLPIVGRLAQLPWNPPPAPTIGDEAAYLLAGDTFAQGRVTNPTHPLWIHFETFHVIQRPTYSARYPIAQGIVLAIGEILFQSPWMGVVLSIGFMCATLCWMLQGWVSRYWSLAGGVLVAAMFLHHYWMDSYWGGAAAAIGGSLVVGALPRIRREDFKAAWWMSCGLVLLASSRPYEGFLIAAPVLAAVIVWSWHQGQLPSILLPVCSLILPFMLFSLYYNWRVTGNMMRLPYTVYDATYSTTPVFHFQQLPTPPQYNNPQMAAAYQQELERFNKQRGWGYLLQRFLQILELEPDDLGKYPKRLWVPLNLLMLCLLPWLFAGTKFKIPVICFALAAFGMTFSRSYFEHYSAPILPLRLLFWVESLRRVSYLKVMKADWAVRFISHLKLIKTGWLPRFMPGIVIFGALALVGGYVLRSPFQVPSMHGMDFDRPRVIAELTRHPGKHLVIVRYSASHDPNREWVFNAADIDSSRIVWARMLDGVDNTPLITYFSDRHVWLLKPDEVVVRLGQYK